MGTGVMSSLTQTGIYSSFTQSCFTLCDLMDCSTPGLPIHHQLLELAQIHVHLVGSLSLLQGMFLTQGSNPGLLHCRQILYKLSQKGSPRILEWVIYPFSGGSS